MTPEAWSIIGMGIAIVVAIAVSNRLLRAEFRAEFRAECDKLHRAIEKLCLEIEKLTERFKQADLSINERIGGPAARQCCLGGSGDL